MRSCQRPQGKLARPEGGPAKGQIHAPRVAAFLGTQPEVAVWSWGGLSIDVMVELPEKHWSLELPKHNFVPWVPTVVLRVGR